jgi:ABC-type cobalamin/Fe3+-siderophores transport system ATPase subunit
MGPSRCGKLTLLHGLAGVLTPDAGEVHFAVSGVVVAALAVTSSASLVVPSTQRPDSGWPEVLRPAVVHISTGGVPQAQVAPPL